MRSWSQRVPVARARPRHRVGCRRSLRPLASEQPRAEAAARLLPPGPALLRRSHQGPVVLPGRPENTPAAPARPIVLAGLGSIGPILPSTAPTSRPARQRTGKVDRPGPTGPAGDRPGTDGPELRPGGDRLGPTQGRPDVECCQARRRDPAPRPFGRACCGYAGKGGAFGAHVAAAGCHRNCQTSKPHIPGLHPSSSLLKVFNSQLILFQESSHRDLMNSLVLLSQFPNGDSLEKLGICYYYRLRKPRPGSVS